SSLDNKCEHFPIDNAHANASSTDLVEFNSSVSLSCSASGISLSFLWLNSSSEVTQSDRVKFTDGGANLTIVNVTRNDQGPFRCLVSNPVSNDASEPVNLSISYGPENVNLSINVSKEYYVEGSNISLSCSAVSRPAAQFYWLLNGDNMTDTGPELKLVNIQMSQSGNYSCQAFNNKTLRYETSQLTARISGAAVTSSTNLTIEGNSVNLTCDAAAGSNLTRLWRKDDSDLILTDNMALNEESRVLSFKSLSKTDSGKYSCEISNPVSNDRVQYIMIVNYGPENVQIDGPSKIDFGKTLTLTCSAESEPSASYTWTLNGTEIHNSSVFTKVITGLSYSGNYTCQAMNNITERRSSAVHQVTVTGNKIPLIASIHQLSSANVFKVFQIKMLTDGNSTLTIVNVTRYDLGPFMCVFNPVSNGNSDALNFAISYGPDNMALTVNGNNSTSFSVGSNLTMLCSAQSNPPALLQWAVRGELVNTTGPLLELFSVSEDQSGPYSCLAFNNHTNMNSTITTNIMISSGFVCILTSTSIPYLSICSQLHPHFALFTQIQVTDEGANLTIVNVTRFDQGPFSCNVSNPVSNGASEPVTLSINYGPENINLTVNVAKEYYVEGSNISLSCSAVSRPAAQFYWLLNRDNLNDTGPELKLMNIQMSQSGNYSCQAFNNKTLRNETSQSSAVTVLERISGAAVTSSNRPIEEKSVNLTCDAAAGSISISISRLWKKNDLNLILADNMALYEENRVLSFKSLNKTDNGKYSCEISNPSLYLPLKMMYGPENVQIQGQSKIDFGKTLTLTCSAESEPSASYTWTLNGTEIHNSSVFTKVITGLSDSGNYTCQAMNKITERTLSAVYYSPFLRKPSQPISLFSWLHRWNCNCVFGRRWSSCWGYSVLYL
uniref:Ig-like domain-containing protein n=1 Tax=Sparus aurata TaxID=8175 RepID=A0A671WH36_SPAAU